MPIYPVKNSKTGETKELNLPIANTRNGERTIPTGIRTGPKV